MNKLNNDSNNTLKAEEANSLPTPTDRPQDLPLDAADEIAETLTRSMIRLSTDEARRKKIGMMLV